MEAKPKANCPVTLATIRVFAASCPRFAGYLTFLIIDDDSESHAMPNSAEHDLGSQRASEAQFLTAHWNLVLKAGHSDWPQATEVLEELST